MVCQYEVIFIVDSIDPENIKAKLNYFNLRIKKMEKKLKSPNEMRNRERKNSLLPLTPKSAKKDSKTIES